MHLHLLPVLLQLSLFVDLVDSFGALIPPPWYPVVLEGEHREALGGWWTNVLTDGRESLR